MRTPVRISIGENSLALEPQRAARLQECEAIWYVNQGGERPGQRRLGKPDLISELDQIASRVRDDQYAIVQSVTMATLPSTHMPQTRAALMAYTDRGDTPMVSPG